MPEARFARPVNDAALHSWNVTAIGDTARFIDNIQASPERGKTCQPAIKIADLLFARSLNISEIAKELDSFYQEPSNAPVPIVMALGWVKKKASGASRKDLEDFEAGLRKIASGLVP